MKRKLSLYVKDMLEACIKIQQFLEGINYEDFIKDDKTSSAVIRKIEIIGEAVKCLPPDIRQTFSDISWSAIAKMRDKVIHFYHEIDYEIIWETATSDIPALIPKLEKVYLYLLDLEKS